MLVELSQKLPWWSQRSFPTVMILWFYSFPALMIPWFNIWLELLCEPRASFSSLGLQCPQPWHWIWAGQVTFGTENYFPHHFWMCCSAQFSLQNPLKKEQIRAGPNPHPTPLCTCESVQETTSRAKCPQTLLRNCTAVKEGFALTLKLAPIPLTG